MLFFVGIIYNVNINSIGIDEGGELNMAKKKTDKKLVWEEEFSCPHCKKKIIATKTKKLLNESVKAEYDEELIVKKSEQTSLPKE